MRLTLGYLLAPVLVATGYRFSKLHRTENRWTYRVIDTVACNLLANVLAPTQVEG